MATGATFFLDSESQIQAVIRGFETPSGTPPATAAGAEPAATIEFRSQPDPPRTGDAVLEVSVKDPAGRPVTDAEVAVTFFMAAMPAMNMPAMKNGASLQHVGGGIYRGTGQWLMAGRWDVTVTVTRRGQRLASRQLSVVAR